MNETQRIYGANVILFEGIMTFVYPELRDVMDMKIFVDTDSDVRLARRCMLGQPDGLSPKFGARMRGKKARFRGKYSVWGA